MEKSLFLIADGGTLLFIFLLARLLTGGADG
jgi:hypothetical protein